LRDTFEAQDASLDSSDDEEGLDEKVPVPPTKPESEAFITTRLQGRGRPLTNDFVRHIRGLMGAGASAKCVRKQLLLDAQYFMMNNKKQYDWFVSQVPKLRWFQYQREGLGAEAYCTPGYKLQRQNLSFSGDSTRLALMELLL
jgi:hypothetical protein